MKKDPNSEICPMCQEKVQKAARKCPHCGENLVGLLGRVHKEAVAEKSFGCMWGIIKFLLLGFVLVFLMMLFT